MLAFDKPWDWIIIALIFVALFGYKKLPDAARSIGRSLRVFKTEIKGMTGDDQAREQARAEQPAEPKALPRAEFVPPPAANGAADRPRPRPAPAPAAGPRGTDAG